MIKYEDADFFKVFPELEAIFPEHYEELSVMKKYPLELNYDKWNAYKNANMIRCITCRKDEELIGYIVFFVFQHLYHKSCKTAIEDIYFLKKQYRKGRTGIKMFQYAEQVLKDSGVNFVVLHTKVKSDNSKLFEYLGYEYTDKAFSKML